MTKRVEARQSLIRFTEYTYPKYRAAKFHYRIADELQAVLRGEVDRLMIKMPPRMGKSELGSKRFPAFSLGHRPDLQFISASATAALAEDFGRDVRNLVASQEYQSLFPGVELAPDSQAKHKWHTNRGGIYYSLGIGGSIMGRGADIALIDDVFASWEDAQSAVWLDKVWSWYTGSLYNRLMPGGAIVLIGHRGNERDLQGRLLEQQAADGDQWRVVEFKAIDDDGRALWPERYPIKALERIKANTSQPEWNALYQQDPSTDDEAILKSAWWNCWPADKRMPEIVFLMQVWDTAFELHEAADFTACTVWGVFFNTDTGRYEIMLLGRYQKRVDFPELRKKAKEYYLAYHHSSIGPVNKVIVEAKATGKPIVQELRRGGIPVNEFDVIRNSRGKEVAKPVKVQAGSVVLSSGSVWYPEGAEWADSVISECRQFRANMSHAHDDLVDTCVMAWIYLRRTWWLQHEDDRDRGSREQIRLVPRGAARTDDNIWDDEDDDEEAA